MMIPRDRIYITMVAVGLLSGGLLSGCESPPMKVAEQAPGPSEVSSSVRPWVNRSSPRTVSASDVSENREAALPSGISGGRSSAGSPGAGAATGQASTRPERDSATPHSASQDNSAPSERVQPQRGQQTPASSGATAAPKQDSQQAAGRRPTQTEQAGASESSGTCDGGGQQGSQPGASGGRPTSSGSGGASVGETLPELSAAGGGGISPSSGNQQGSLPAQGGASAATGQGGDAADTGPSNASTGESDGAAEATRGGPSGEQHDEPGGDASLGVIGPAGAAGEPRVRAEDAGWAVAPDTHAAVDVSESEGQGGGQQGSRSGGLAGDGAGGSDGGGPGHTAPAQIGETVGKGGGADSVVDPAAAAATQSESRVPPDLPGDDTNAGQTEVEPAIPPGGDVSTHPHQETHDEDDSGGGGSGQPGGHTEDSQTAAEHEESKGDQPDHTAAAAESDRANQPAEQGTLESDPPPSSDASLAPPSHRPRRFDDADLAQVSAPAAGEVLEPWQREARGVWKLLAVHDPENDFLPQGADERYIGIDPDARVLRAVLSWDGIATVSMAAEFEVGFRPEQVEIQPLPQAPSAFPHAPSTLLGGGQFKPAASPPPCELRWSRAGSRLRIGGSEYERAEPDTMIDLLNQPEPTTHGSEGFGEEGDISDPLGSAATVDFFGVQAEGRYFCYVVDVSGSMATNNGMHRLKAELERSLESLPRGTRFAVLPFNHTLRDLQSSWVSASPRRAADIGHRLSRVGAAGGTDPSEAFAWAFRRLNPRPDAIFFMTDGKVNDEPRLVSQLASLNASAPRTRIHTIGLGNDAAMQLLERLAAEHGGTARSVR